MPRHDNTFGGGNFDADDLDEWLTIQRDWQVDAGIEPVSEEELLRVRERAARAVQAVFAELGLPPISDDEVAVATAGYDAREMPDRDRAADVAAADDLLARGVSGLDVALALDRSGFEEVAEAVLAHAASPGFRGLPPDGSGHRRRRRRALGGQRPERVRRPGHGLPARGRALGASPVAPAGRRARGAARRGRDRRADRRRQGAGRGGRGRCRGRRRGRACLRRLDQAHDRRPRPSRGARRGLRGGAGGRRRAAPDPRPPRRGRRVHRARRRAPVGLRASRSACSRRARR